MVLLNPMQRQQQKLAAHEEFSSQELDHMRQMLDDPDVSAEVKNNFLYALSNAGRLSEDEIGQYAPEVGADPVDVAFGGRDYKENLENARTALGTAERQNNQGDVSRAKEAVGQGGYSTSDEVLDQAEPALRLFDDFYPRFQQARELIGDHTPEDPEQYRPVSLGDAAAEQGEGSAATYSHTGIDPQSVRSGIGELRGIDFAAFRADADMLTAAHGDVEGASEALDSAWGDGTADWTGDAKAAAKQVNDGMSKAADTLAQALSDAPGSLGDCVEVLERNVVNFTQQVLGLYQDGTIAGLTPQQVDEYIASMTALPAQVEEMRGKWLFGEVVEAMETHLREAEASLTDFCADYRARADQFHAQAAEYVQCIDGVYAETLASLTQPLEPDPFAEADAGDAGVGQPQVPGGTGPGGMPGGGAPGGGMPGGGAPGGGMPGGGGPGAGGGAVPSAEDLIPDQPGGTNPVTGEDLALDPETGEPYPIDPETGDAITDAGGREQLTVEQGGNRFTMTEPDAEGKMALTVEGGEGELGEYRLDFGAEEGAAEGADSPGEDPSFGPDGVGQAGERVYRPGEDGTIRIEDGDLTITAEQPDGPDGPTRVTVADGQGEPVSYTLGGANGPGEHAGVNTLPAEGGAAGEPGRWTDSASTPGGAGGGTPDGAAGTLGEHTASDAAWPEATESRESPESPQPAAAAAPAAASSLSGDLGSVTGGDTGSGGESVDGGDSAGATHVSAVSDGGGSTSGGGGGGSALGGDPDAGAQSQSTPSGANLGTAPGGDAPTGMSQGGGAAPASGGGMGMMGGMGGGAGGGQSGDQERASSAYRIEGNIFDSMTSAVRISGSIGDDAADVPVRFSR
ncbi:WXG100 family type VII secretion target [Saccharomonospora piscinae]|uniref:WXG100 family type VII secretion target n=1 Tax=Saccharomonospora piscinae TaxID=687388 RepID=UPI0004B2A652|nr:hypothetical protein [Saccharomonospora piscinae]